MHDFPTPDVGSEMTALTSSVNFYNWLPEWLELEIFSS